MTRPDSYAVVGHPIDHSKSPFIHARFAAQTGERIDYRALDVRPEDFETRVRTLRAQGVRGLNVTVPLKELAHDLADELSARARRAGAVNTLSLSEHGPVLGDNTDGAGLVRDLRVNQELDIVGRRVLVLGAGGAAAGVLGPLLDERPAALVVANRTAARAQALCARFRDQGPVRPRGFGELTGLTFDLVVNATSASLTGTELPLARALFAPGACAYDMVYGATPTAFLRRAGELGAGRLADGRGMLVEQAAESFLIWRGRRPDTVAVIQALGDLLRREAQD